MTREAGERSFDELASGLASGTLSRGKALRLLGAALVGGALAFTPKVAEALHKCDSTEDCRSGICCDGTCCGVLTGEGGPGCFPASKRCGKGRVLTFCENTVESGNRSVCLAACFLNEPCFTSADCDSGEVCAQLEGGNSCVSRCKGRSTL
jgi:hypothetical protein